MTTARMVGLLLGLSLIGIAVVWLRVDQARHARAIQVLLFRQAELRQTVRSQEVEMARLQAPHKIRERCVQLGLVADSSDGLGGSGVR